MNKLINIIPTFLCLVKTSAAIFICFFFFFKQKTAYEIGWCDWSSDVCSSDLPAVHAPAPAAVEPLRPRTHELLEAVLWTQTAVEHELLCRQAFALAAERLERALKDLKWTALPDQKGDYEKLPTAVVFDADETIIDNSEYEAELIGEDKSHDSALFEEWARKARAKAIPGALEFTRLLKEKGVETIVL